ncbi:hypothetical protein JCM14469_38380 [Desulfatiferula olefinivorans]
MSTLSLRLPNSLHEKIRELTKEEGISINQFISSAAAEKMAALMTERYLLQRAQKADVNRFRAVLDKVPDVDPEEQDRID